MKLFEEIRRGHAAGENDLSTSHPEAGFLGLRKGDQCCLCAACWLEAHRAGKALTVVLDATHEGALICRWKL